MKHTLTSAIKFIIGWPLTLIALFFIAKFITPNLPTLFISLQSTNILLLLFGIIGIIIYFFIRSYFWRELLSLYDLRLSFKETTWLWGSAELRRYIPGNIWTILGRTSNFSQKDIPKSTILSTFLLEAEFIVVGSIFLSLLACNFLLYGLLPPIPHKGVFVILVMLVSYAFILLFLGNQYIIKKLNLSNTLTLGKWKLSVRFLPHFSFKTHCYLFFLQSVALFFFGLGTYFAISSIKLLYVHDIFTFIGFFVFSLFVGYISFITPMGLGVREGMMTFGLMKFIPLSLAGFSAIFSRIIFIFSELCFLLLAYVWYKTRHHLFKHMEAFIRHHWQEIILWTLFVLYILYLTTATFLRYDNFYSGRFDLGNMDQTVWNTLHGRIFQQTDANGTDIVSRLIFHADFILILLAPFYILWQDPKMLLLIQTVTLSFGGIFVYLIAKQKISKTVSLLFALAYFLSPSVINTNLYDFHGVTLATTFLLGAFYFFQKRTYFWYVLFLILAGLTKEEVWIIVAFFGIYTCITAKKDEITKKILGGFITILSLAAAFYLILYAIPAVRGSGHFALSFYSDFGSSPSEIVKTILFNPLKTIRTIFQPQQLLYLFEIFFPLGFLPFASPLFLIFAVPDLTIDLLSNSNTWHQIYYQYTASITPFVFIAGIYGYQKFIKKFPSHAIYICYYLLFTILMSAYTYGALPGSLHPNIQMFDSPQPYASIIDNFLTDIPRKYSIAATNNLGSHLSHRQKIFTIPVGIDKADIITFLLNDPGAQPSLAAQKLMAQNMKKDKNYIEIFKQGDFVVFEKRNLYLQKEPNTTRVKLFPLSIPALQHRDYVGSEIAEEEKGEKTASSQEYTISYSSDGLQQYALVAIPKGSVPKTGFPVIIINHDYYPDDSYNTLTSDISIVDYFTQKGFMVIKPDYRGQASSEIDNKSLVPLGYSVDILNLISSLKTFYPADSKNIFLWGQGLGGEVVLKTLEAIGENEDKTLLESVKGAVVWSPIIDPEEWPSSSTMMASLRGDFGSMRTNPIFWKSITVRNYLDDIHTPVEIDQGTSDQTVAYTSSIELYNDLVSFNKNAKLRVFPNDDHDFSLYKSQALLGDSDFFTKHLE